ncbi:MAG: M1 family metallopeptidase, partial [Firmicutes bacterium]|nr:M1 family metallopeptidase [Bacillota bacterium]
MNKKLWIALALVLAFACVTAAVLSCGRGGRGELERASKNLTHYTLEAEYSALKNTLAVSETVDYINNYETPLKYLCFHLYGNAYRADAAVRPIGPMTEAKAYPNGESWGGLTVTSIKLNGKTAPILIEGTDKNILRVNFNTPLYPTARYRIDITYRLVLANALHRLGYNGSTVNFGNWYPVACVYENGKFRTDPYYSYGDPFYSECANYDVTVTAAEKYTAAASAAPVSEMIKDGKRVCRYSARAVRDFAFVLSDKFQTVSAAADKTLVTYYYYRDADPAASLAAATDAVKLFNELFGTYPYADYAVVQAGFNHGGMEYPGLVYISDTLTRERHIETIVHETAHQWWYGLVGNDQVSHAWMDEGLTDYSTSLFYEKMPAYGLAREDRLSETLQTYLLYVDLYKTFTGELNTAMDRRVNEFGSEYEYVCMT